MSECCARNKRATDPTKQSAKLQTSVMSGSSLMARKMARNRMAAKQPQNVAATWVP